MLIFITLPLRTSLRSHPHPSNSLSSIILYALIIAISLPSSLSIHNESYGYDDPRFTYSPRDQWHFDHHIGLAYTNKTGATISTPFFGSAVYLSSSRKTDRSVLRVTLDDQDHYDVDLNGPDTLDTPPQVIWGTSYVLEGNHTFVAINIGADPTRPYVAFASLTITIGSPTNSAPPVSSTPFYSLGQKEDDHTERNALIRRIGAAIGAVISFLVLVFLGYRLQRRRHLQQLEQYLHNHRAHAPTTTAKANPVDVESIALSSNLNQADNVHYQHHYFSVHNPQKSPATFPAPPREQAESLLIVSEDPKTQGLPHSKESDDWCEDPRPSEESDESEFWKPRQSRNSSTL